MMAGFDDTEILDVDGTSLAYREQGGGDPVVLVHGGVSDLRTWHHQLPALAQGYRAIAYSRRYARPNAEIPDGADDPLDRHVDDLLALIEAKASGPAHLVSHSLGGVIALMAACRMPRRVRSLVLIEPPVFGLFGQMPLSSGRFLSLLLTRPRLALALARFGARVMVPAARAFREGDDRRGVEIFGQGVLGRTSFNTMPPARYQQVWENRNPERAQILGKGFPALDVAAIERLTQPVLILQGSDSPALFHRLNARLAELLPKSRIAEVADASHILHEDKPSFVNAEIEKFLNGVPKRP